MRSARRSPSAGFTLLEVLIGLSILTAGVISVIMLFPATMKGNEAAELRTLGASLMAMKAEEIRRDNDASDKLINAIKNLTSPTPPIPFSVEPRLAYRFSGTTVIYRHFDKAGNLIDDPNDPRDDPGVARVIVEINPKWRPGREIFLDELRFDK